MGKKEKSVNRISGSVRAGIAVAITAAAVLACVLLAVVFCKSSLLFGGLRVLMVLLTAAAAVCCVWLCGRFLYSL